MSDVFNRMTCICFLQSEQLVRRVIKEMTSGTRWISARTIIERNLGQINSTLKIHSSTTLKSGRKCTGKSFKLADSWFSHPESKEFG